MNPFHKNAEFFLDSRCRGLYRWAKKLIDLSEWCDDKFSPLNWKTGGLTLRGRHNNNWGK